MKRRRGAERSRGSKDATTFVFYFSTWRYDGTFLLRPEVYFSISATQLHFCVLSSDITTLTSASYQSSLPMHTGQHLLSIQGTAALKFLRIAEPHLGNYLRPFDTISQLILVFASLRQSRQSQSTWCAAWRT